MSGPLPRIIDDLSIPDHLFYGGQWERRRDGQRNAYQRTLTTCRLGTPADDPSYVAQPSMQFNFTGTEVSIVGRPTAGLRLNYTLVSRVRGEAPGRGVMADSGVNFTGSPLVGKQGVTLLNLPSLSPNASHTLTLFPYRGRFFLDYISFVPPPTTSSPPGPTGTTNSTTGGLSIDSTSDPFAPSNPTQTFLVDNTDPRIRYVQSSGIIALNIPNEDWQGARTPSPTPEPAQGDTSSDALEIMGFVPVGGGWVSTRAPNASWEFNFDGDFISFAGPLYRPPPPSPGQGGLRTPRLTIEYTLMHRRNRTVPPGLSGSSTRTFGSAADGERRWEVREYATVYTTGGEWSFQMKVLEIPQGGAFYLDTITFGTNPTVRLQTFELPGSDTSDGGSQNSDASVIGGVIGGIALLSVIGILIWQMQRRRTRKAEDVRRREVEAQNEAIALQAMIKDAERRRDSGEGPPTGPAPPPWSPPSSRNDESDEPPPQMPDSPRIVDRTQQQGLNGNGRQLPNPPPSPRPSHHSPAPQDSPPHTGTSPRNGEAGVGAGAGEVALPGGAG